MEAYCKPQQVNMSTRNTSNSEIYNSEIAHPEVLKLKDSNGRVYYGAHQNWYDTWMKRLSGCGPTTCSNLIWYLSKTREGYNNLLPPHSSMAQLHSDDRDGPLRGGNSRSDITALMNTIWNYVTPGLGGVNRPSIFIDGALKYATEKGIELTVQRLDIPSKEEKRPDLEAVLEFLGSCFLYDAPVGFLNLSSGKLRNLDDWHWVTLVGLQGDYAIMYDQGRKQKVDLNLWLKSTTKEGGFVCLL